MLDPPVSAIGGARHVSTRHSAPGWSVGSKKGECLGGRADLGTQGCWAENDGELSGTEQRIWWRPWYIHGDEVSLPRIFPKAYDVCFRWQSSTSEWVGEWVSGWVSEGVSGGKGGSCGEGRTDGRRKRKGGRV